MTNDIHFHGGTGKPGASRIKHAKTQIDLARLRGYRLQRLRQQLQELDYGACVLFDPVNLRYATGSRNMQVFMLRNPGRYVFIPVEGPVVLFDFDNCEHLSEGIETIDDIRPAITLSFVASGYHLEHQARRWAEEIAQLMKEHSPDNRRLAVDSLHPAGVFALGQQGIAVMDGQEPVERARAIKSEEEIECIRISIAATEIGMTEMREALQPGMTENELWSILHQNNIVMDGDYVETRLLSSGERTNPWFQECSDRVIQAGDLVSFDTDVNGPFGYYTDISRTFLCGTGKPTAEQRRLYQTAYEQVQENISKIKPGKSFREYAQESWQIPDEFFANRYFCIAHGTGLSGEYPYIVYEQDFEQKGYDGIIEENMVLCVESYIGGVGGKEGVKLEEQILVTKNGAEILSNFPYEDIFLHG